MLGWYAQHSLWATAPMSSIALRHAVGLSLRPCDDAGHQPGDIRIGFYLDISRGRTPSSIGAQLELLHSIGDYRVGAIGGVATGPHVNQLEVGARVHTKSFVLGLDAVRDDPTDQPFAPPFPRTWNVSVGIGIDGDESKTVMRAEGIVILAIVYVFVTIAESVPHDST
jgi:hypothetical protein